MNKIFSLFTMALLSVMALTLGSCTEEYEYSAAKVEASRCTSATRSALP